MTFITTSGLKKGVVILLVTSLLIFSVLDALIFRQFVPHIPKLVSKTYKGLGIASTQVDKVFISDPIFASNWSTSENATYDNLVLDTEMLRYNMTTLAEGMADLRAQLKTLGYEPAEDHAFKSPYIITPKIYPLTPSKVPANPPRKTKVVSCFNCPSWYVKSLLNQYNLDFKACPYSECLVDATGKNKTTADALLMFVGKLGNTKVPARPPGQIWIKCYWEAPPHYGYPRDYAPWKSQFNWTFTYRTDSDIFAPNNLLAWRNREELLPDDEYLKIAKMKTKTAAWWVSNCRPSSKRDLYVKEMQKYIDVDIYGRCGTLQCSKTKYDECERMLTTTYKFYLSFENALCKDYVTEKFFRNFAYRSHIVPVGRAGFDYGKYIPPGSYVNAANFKKAKDLALYLKKLGNDPVTYAKMLKEKDKLVALNRKYDWCDICEKLHTDKETKVIPDIKAWSHSNTCISATDIV